MQGKVWGTTETLQANAFVEVHRITIKPRMRCSNHLHEFKWNIFYVISGSLTIAVAKNDYDLEDETVLGPGDMTTVKPTEYHEFRTGDEPCVALEIYHPEPLSEDIKRKDCGGPTPPTNGLPRKDLQPSRWDGI